MVEKHSKKRGSTPLESPSPNYKTVAKMEAESSEPSQGQLYTGISDGPLILIFSLSIVTFGLINVTLGWVLPRVITLGRSSQRRFRNHAVSFTHACLCSLLYFYCYFSYEGQLSSFRDLVTGGSDACYIVITISTSYFLWDLVDNALQGRTLSDWEITFHHLVTIVCTGYTVVYRFSVWFSIVCLMVETNAIFLNLRKMMHITGVPAHSRKYAVVKVLNIVTFVVFRGMSQSVLLAGHLTVRHMASPYVVMPAAIVMLFMLVSNPIFLWRLIKSDFLNSVEREEGATGDANGDIDTKTLSGLKTKAKMK